jgi:hypothetical protein
MKTPLLAVVVSFAVAAACGGSSGSGANSPAPAASSSAFTFGDVAFFAGAGTDKPGPMLHADGTVSMDGKTLCTLSQDGTLHAQDGKLILQLKADGTLATADGKVLGTINADGALTLTKPAQGATPASTVTVSFDASGNVTGGPSDATPVRAQGVTPATRRAAMVTLVLFLFADKSQATVTNTSK